MTRLRITTQWTHCEPGVDMIWIIHESRQINGGIQAASPTRHCWLLHNVANSWQSGLLKEVALDPPGGYHIPLGTLGDGLTHTVKPQFLWKITIESSMSNDINWYQRIINTSYFGGWHLGLAPTPNFNGTGSSAFKCGDPFPKPVRLSASLTPLHPLHPLPLVSSGFLHQVPLATEPRNSAPGKVWWKPNCRDICHSLICRFVWCSISGYILYVWVNVLSGLGHINTRQLQKYHVRNSFDYLDSFRTSSFELHPEIKTHPKIKPCGFISFFHFVGWCSTLFLLFSQEMGQLDIAK